MASGKTLSAANLEALGAKRLAALLLEISAGDPTVKRRLRLALAGNAGPDQAAREIAKRLASIAKARSFVERHKVKPLAADLQAQRKGILDLVAPGDPQEAFELVWRLVACAASVLDRSDDSNGRLLPVFEEAAHDLGPLAQAANLDPLVLAERAFEALRADAYGAWHEVVPILAPQMGPAGLDRLKHLIEIWQAEPVVKPSEAERRVIGWSMTGKIYADEVESGQRHRIATFALQQIADALGDADSYIAQFDAQARMVPSVAADIARRLLEAGRLQEAWDAIEVAQPSRGDWFSPEWEQARLDVLEALGCTDEAQAFRWQRFRDTLEATHLRGYLRKLPDFEDVEAEQRAIDHALTHRDVHLALEFFLAWPDLEQASRLVLARAQELDGDRYEVLTPAGEALETKHPLAATLALRPMIDFALGAARSSRYKHAARHLAECESLAGRIDDFGNAPDHAAYLEALRATHGRKAAFWQEVDLAS